MIKINKKTKSTIKCTFYNTIENRDIADLSNYIDFVCAVTQDGRLLIEKKMSRNEIQLIDKNKLKIFITPLDTSFLIINPSYEEIVRKFEIFGISNDRTASLIYKDDFYLEGSGYYVVC